MHLRRAIEALIATRKCSTRALLRAHLNHVQKTFDLGILRVLQSIQQLDNCLSIIDLVGVHRLMGSKTCP
jgi:hypothetical protein